MTEAAVAIHPGPPLVPEQGQFVRMRNWFLWFGTFFPLRPTEVRARLDLEFLDDFRLQTS